MKAGANMTWARALSYAAAAMVAAATIPSLIPDWYRHLDRALWAGTFGQDMTSLLLVAVLAWAMRATRAGSSRGPVVWLAVLGFWAYSYALYAFGPTVTPVFPLYVAIMGASVYAIVLVGTRLDLSAYHESLVAAPVWPAVTTLSLTVGLLGPVWCIQMFAGIAAGHLPPTGGVLALDLGFVFPAMVLVIVGLWTRRPWEWALALPLVMLAAVMLWSLVVSELLAGVTGLAGDPWPLTVAFATLAALATVAAALSLRRLGTSGHGVADADADADGAAPPGRPLAA